MNEMALNLLIIALMFALFWFLIIRPQQKRQKEIREMHANLQKGDKIITIGGLHGTIESLDEKKIVLNVGDNTKLTYDRAAVREVVKED